MINADFLVDSVDDTGFVIGKNYGSDTPVGTVFTTIPKSRVEGDPPNFTPVDLGVIAQVALILKEVNFYRKAVPEIPHGHSAGLRFAGTGLDTLKQALATCGKSEYVHLRGPGSATSTLPEASEHE
jgi:hypothetical protein